MNDPTTMIAMAGFAFAGTGMMLVAALKGWQGWLELKRLELGRGAPREAPAGSAGTIERIEMADLKERIRKLESLAACIDL